MLLEGWKHAYAHNQTVLWAVILLRAFTLKISLGSLDWSTNLLYFCKISKHAALTRLLGTLERTVNQRIPSYVTPRCRIYWKTLTRKEQISTQATDVCSAVLQCSQNLDDWSLICQLNSSYYVRPKSNHNSIPSEYCAETHKNGEMCQKAIWLYSLDFFLRVI